MDGENPVSPTPIQRQRRQVLVPRAAIRQDRQPEPDASSAGNGEPGIYVSRVPSFQGKKTPAKGATTKEGDLMENSPISYMLVSNEKRPLRGQRDTPSMKSKVVVYYGQDLGSRVWKKMFNILRQCMWLHVAFKNH